MKKGLLFLMVLIISISTNAQITSSGIGSDGLPATGSTDWSNTLSWVGGVIPTDADDVIIAAGHTVRVTNSASSPAVAGSITVNLGGQLFIDVASAITVSGDLTNNSKASPIGVLFNDSVGAIPGSLIVNGSYVGTDGARRVQFSMNPDVSAASLRWFLMSSPLVVDRITNDFMNRTRVFQPGNVDPNRISFGNYDDSRVGNKYNYYSTNGGDNDGFSAGLDAGKGYAIAIEDDGDAAARIQMRGELNTSAVSIAISDAGNGFNLLGNPYASYLSANTDGDATNNVLAVNSAILAETTLWFYDGAAGSFITRNLSDTNFDIAPMQGFFVKATTGGGTFNFTKAMMTHNVSPITYFKSASNARFEFDLTLTNGEASSKASVRYIEGTTTGWDNGYDSSTFGGYAAGNLEIATQLVSNNTGKKLAIQSLPNSNYEGTVIPLSISAVANKEFTITADVKNIPENIKLYLEDRVAKTFTRLDEENATFNFTPSVSLSGEGRFYIHTTAASVLNIDSETLTNVSIFSTNKNTLKIIGLQNGNTSVKIFNILGKQVVSTSFKSNGSKEILLPNLNSGVYIVKLENEAGSLNKKIILE
ncbi:T9SS type A sorting domain-containing protein [Polaribacter sp. BAL334]|uniref:T9SS type A sorting domain-containing protein n=1 Tax=Polaribacter sp. BAL334 TaxID=1708178 RepID=UPI0018D2247A|nr:T9SS type A sorting domain-containing protein [Polaribacter sp. BAL334]MBG7613108.1 T9SS type A sorting domain-containing protein [Polaribacter sp. BAL334]